MTNDQFDPIRTNKAVSDLIINIVNAYDKHGDTFCANYAHTAIVETSKTSELIAAKTFRRCVNHKSLSNAINHGLKADEVRGIWRDAPFTLIETALKTAKSETNAVSNKLTGLVEGLQISLCFHTEGSYQRKGKYLIALAKQKFSFSPLVSSPLDNELCIEAINICLKNDEKFLEIYMNLLQKYIKEARLIEVLSTALVPLLSNGQTDENLFLLFRKDRLGIELFEEVISQCNQITNVDPWLKHIKPLLSSTSTISKGIRIASLILRLGNPLDSCILPELAIASAKATNYGSQRKLHTKITKIIRSINPNSELLELITNECCNNLHKLPTLRQSADALAQLEDFIDDRYQALLEKTYESIKANHTNDSLAAFVVLTKISPSKAKPENLIECFLVLSENLSISLVETAKYLESIFIHSNFSLVQLNHILIKENFNRALLRIIIALGSYNEKDREMCFDTAINLGCKSSSDCLHKKNILKDLVSHEKHMSTLDWPLTFMLSKYSDSFLAKSVPDNINNALLLFLPEYSITTIYNLSERHSQSSINLLLEWYFKKLPEYALQQIERVGEYKSQLTKIFLETASSCPEWRNLPNKPIAFIKRLITIYLSDLGEILFDIRPYSITQDATKYYHSLTYKDIILVKKWNNDRDLNAGQASKLLSARVAEKFVKNILSDYYGASEIIDTSIQQIENRNSSTEWLNYDLYIARESTAIDCKNARTTFNSNFFSEYQIPKFKKQRKSGAGVHYACCLSEYIPASHFNSSTDNDLLESCHNLNPDEHEYFTISLLGVITKRILNDLRTCLRKHLVPIEIITDYEQGSDKSSYFIPEWMLGTCDWMHPDDLRKSSFKSLIPCYDLLGLCVKALHTQSSENFGYSDENLVNTHSDVFKAEFYLNIIYGSSVPTTFENHFSPLDIEPKVGTIGFLADLLKSASHNHVKAAIYLWWLSELILCLNRQKNFNRSIFSILDKSNIEKLFKLVGDQNNYMQMAWNTFYELANLASNSNFRLPKLTNFRLHTRGLLTACTEDGVRLTLIAYCGGSLKLPNQYSVSCGNNPLHAPKHEWCSICGRLICDKCNFCKIGCSRHL